MSGEALITREILEEQSIDELTGNPLSESVVGNELLTSETNFASLANTSSETTLSIEEDLTGLPGGTVTVPIFINEAAGVQSLSLTLDYDTDILNVVDPDETTETNEAVSRTGVSADWILTAGEGDDPDAELANPVASVDEDAGEITVSLFNPNDITPAGSGNILEIDFTIAADAESESTATIDLRTARLGIDGETDETVIGDSLLGDGSVTVGTSGIDIDGNGNADALTDGVLIVRHLFGFSGDSLVNGAIATDATRTAADDIQTYISEIESSIDIDGNGSADALTDGVLIVRHLFGFSGDSLVNGAIATDATRTAADDIANAIDDLIP